MVNLGIYNLYINPAECSTNTAELLQLLLLHSKGQLYIIDAALDRLVDLSEVCFMERVQADDALEDLLAVVHAE